MKVLIACEFSGVEREAVEGPIHQLPGNRCRHG